MQPEVEVQFCDLCGTSVPLSDLDKGAAIRHQAKTIGACCLGVLRRGDSPLADLGAGQAGGPGASATGQSDAPGAAGEPGRSGAAETGREGRSLLLLGLALVALLVSTFYLELSQDKQMKPLAAQLASLVSAQQSDSEVLQGLGVAADSMARKADVEAMLERLVALEQAQQLQQEQLREQLDKQRNQLAAIAQETRQLSATTVDYRPLFDELRAQQQRLATALADLRSMPVAAAPAPVAVATRPEPDAAPAAPASTLPEPLAAAVRKLDSADAAVRFEAVATLVDSKNPAVLRSLLPLVRDADAFVRRLTVEGLRDFRQPDAVEALLAALTDKEPTVAETAWNSLKKLTGQQFPFDAAAPGKDVRQRAIQRWLDWWEKNKGSFGA